MYRKDARFRGQFRPGVAPRPNDHRTGRRSVGRAAPGRDGLRACEPTANSGEIRGDESFAVHDLDSAWPRRVFFYQPERDLAGFLDLAGNEPVMSPPGCHHAARLSGGSWIERGQADRRHHFGLVYDDAQGVAHIAFPTAGGCRPMMRQNAKNAPTPISSTRDLSP